MERVPGDGNANGGVGYLSNSVASLPCSLEARLTDSVVIDAKRILLRYGTPIMVLDKVADEERIRLAREIAKTPLPERELRLRELLTESGHL